jgi:hypothetical protein
MLRLQVTLKQDKAQYFQSWLEHYIGNDVVEGETSHPNPDEVSHSYMLNIGGKAINTADMTRKLAQLEGVVHCAFKFFQEED